MKLSIAKGATSVLVRVFIQDSSSTTGEGLTGLVFNTSGLTCYRMRDDDGNAAATAITLATATRGTWASGGFVEKDATNAPGWYEFGIPNNALATGSRSVDIHFQGAADMAPLPVEIELTGWNNQDAVRGGMTALPNAAAEAAGGLYTRGTGAGQITQSTNGQIDVDVKKINSVVTTPVTTIKAVQGLTAADTIETYTGNTKQTGDGYAALTAAQAEPGQATPAANASVVTKIAYLYKAWRNKKTQTASEFNLFNDDASTVDQKSTFSNNGTTATVGEIATGP